MANLNNFSKIHSFFRFLLKKSLKYGVQVNFFILKIIEDLAYF